MPYHRIRTTYPTAGGNRVFHRGDSKGGTPLACSFPYFFHEEEIGRPPRRRKSKQISESEIPDAVFDLYKVFLADLTDLFLGDVVKLGFDELFADGPGLLGGIVHEVLF